MNEIAGISGAQSEASNSDKAAQEFDSILAAEIAKAAVPVGMMTLSPLFNLVLQASKDQGS